MRESRAGPSGAGPSRGALLADVGETAVRQQVLAPATCSPSRVISRAARSPWVRVTTAPQCGRSASGSSAPFPQSMP